MNKNIFFITLVTVAIIVIYFFSNIDSSRLGSNNKKLQISASFYPLYFFSSRIGGYKAEVKNITPAGSEPHDYEPTTQDIARIESGNMLVINGGVEAWGDKIKDNLKGTNVKIIVAGQGLLTQQDPHVWLDPELAKKEARVITQGFISIDPTNSNYYEDNEKNLDIKLDQLDSKYKQGLQNCLSRDIITSHAAFGHLASRYGLNQVTVTGVSPDEEPSAQQLGKVAKFAREHNVKYIFFETLVSPKLSETIANEVGAKTLVLDPLEGLSDDDKKLGKNYFTVMEDNLRALQEALQCNK